MIIELEAFYGCILVTVKSEKLSVSFAKDMLDNGCDYAEVKQAAKGKELLTCLITVEEANELISSSYRRRAARRKIAELDYGDTVIRVDEWTGRHLFGYCCN